MLPRRPQICSRDAVTAVTGSGVPASGVGAVGKWPAAATATSPAAVGHLPTAPTPLAGTPLPHRGAWPIFLDLWGSTDGAVSRYTDRGHRALEHLVARRFAEIIATRE